MVDICYNMMNFKNIMLSEESKLEKNAVSPGTLKCRHQEKIRHKYNLLGETSVKEKGKNTKTL